MKHLFRWIICFLRSVELHEKVIGAFIENTGPLLIGNIRSDLLFYEGI
ncbi:hypothetical protein QUQ58_004637 [Escherichia coli]|nr:hypothetical protein [Escherichia coli]